MTSKVSFINTESSTPIFQQIVEEIERQILVGELSEGDFLISIREFASKHLVNPNTVAKAYQQLQMLDLVESVRGTGLVVKKVNPKKSLGRVNEILNTKISELIKIGKALGVTPNEIIKMLKDRE